MDYLKNSNEYLCLKSSKIFSNDAWCVKKNILYLKCNEWQIVAVYRTKVAAKTDGNSPGWISQNTLLNWN